MATFYLILNDMLTRTYGTVVVEICQEGALQVRASSDEIRGTIETDHLTTNDRARLIEDEQERIYDEYRARISKWDAHPPKEGP